jgi:hypothetical protein
MRAEKDRREFLLGWISGFLQKLAERQKSHERAEGNGHALN